MIWLKFAAVQLAMLATTVAGWFLLIPFCLTQAWETTYPVDDRADKVSKSIKDGRTIDRWSAPLNYVYGNPEDGVSGQQARVWDPYGTLQPYMPGVPDWWRAYCWSALRNSCDNLKYVFADPKGPLVTFKLFGRTAKIGWQMENGYNVPVLSL